MDHFSDHEQLMIANGDVTELSQLRCIKSLLTRQHHVTVIGWCRIHTRLEYLMCSGPVPWVLKPQASEHPA